MFCSLLSTLAIEEGRIGLLLRGSRCLVTLCLLGTFFNEIGEGAPVSRIALLISTMPPAFGESGSIMELYTLGVGRLNT